jgi:hypothetical protein
MTPAPQFPHDEEFAREEFTPPRRNPGSPDSYHPSDPDRPDEVEEPQ